MDGLLDHAMVRVGDVDEAIDWYAGNFGYDVEHRTEMDDRELAWLGPADRHEDGARLELESHHDGRSYEVGDAWGHLAVRVEDLYAAYEELMDNGVPDYRDPDSCGGSYAFVKDPWGHEIEIVERENGARWSIDHTMYRVEDADLALGWWARKFGYATVRRWEADTFANFFVQHPDAPPEAMSLEVTYNYDGRTYSNPGGWGHLAVDVEDVDEYWDLLLEREAEDYRGPAETGGGYAFTRDPAGHEVEIV